MTTTELPGQLELTFGPTMADRFEQFHAENPRVYTTLVRLAREWVARTGRHKIGIATLYERVRWEIAITTNDPDFKINDHYRAFYARLIMWQEPDLAGLFDCRTSEADEWLQNYRPAGGYDA